ncbi:hypothetical protein C8Q79DRAFT_1053428 [Trametes meyenii]|nr:hypothetical protein C8Q79DRAFT_1053428 [Trametes meyenii]
MPKRSLRHRTSVANLGKHAQKKQKVDHAKENVPPPGAPILSTVEQVTGTTEDIMESFESRQKHAQEAYKHAQSTFAMITQPTWSSSLTTTSNPESPVASDTGYPPLPIQANSEGRSGSESPGTGKLDSKVPPGLFRFQTPLWRAAPAVTRRRLVNTATRRRLQNSSRAPPREPAPLASPRADLARAR